MVRRILLLCVRLALVSGSLAGMVAGQTPVAASYPTVTGAGSTWVQIALDQWRADIARQGYQINYQGVGSSAGRSLYIIGQLDFAASEIPFQPDELNQLNAAGKHWQYLPDVAGGTSLMYNLHAPDGSRITNLKLNADAAARLFTGQLTSWQDPEIQSLNPGLQISEHRVVSVIRSDGSGTSAQFSLYLASQAPGVWGPFSAGASGGACPAPCSIWPIFGNSVSQSGSDGVANFVANDSLGSGAIGYVEAGYAFGRRFPIANLHNASGNFVPGANDPNVFSRDVATALAHASLNPDLTQNLSGVYVAPEANAYPMSSYSYMIAPTTNTPFDPGKGFVLGTWIIYIACGGQREATPLGYSPLPPNLVAADFAAVNRIPGHPATPPIDYAHCPNPTLVGSLGGNAGKTPTTKSGPAATATSTAGANAGAAASASTANSGLANSNLAAAGAGSDDLFGLVHVTLLDGAARQRQLLGALAAAARAKAPPGTPMYIAAALLAGAVFGPILVSMLRGRTADA